MSINHDRMSHAEYLKTFVNSWHKMKGQWYVDFEQDANLNYSSRIVELPLSKLVIGLANGWAKNEGEKVVFFPSDEIRSAYEDLLESGVAPRGFMFWVIGEEGTNGIDYAKDLASILKPRKGLGYASYPSGTSDL